MRESPVHVYWMIPSAVQHPEHRFHQGIGCDGDIHSRICIISQEVDRIEREDILKGFSRTGLGRFQGSRDGAPGKLFHSPGRDLSVYPALFFFQS